MASYSAGQESSSDPEGTPRRRHWGLKDITGWDRTEPVPAGGRSAEAGRSRSFMASTTLPASATTPAGPREPSCPASKNIG